MLTASTARVLLAVALSVAAVACGASPTAPSSCGVTTAPPVRLADGTIWTQPLDASGRPCGILNPATR